MKSQNNKNVIYRLNKNEHNIYKNSDIIKIHPKYFYS